MVNQQLQITLFSLLLVAIIFISGITLSAQVSYVNYTVVLNAGVFFDQAPQKPVNFTMWIGLLGVFRFSWGTNQSGSVIQQQEISLDSRIQQYQRYFINNIRLYTDSCLHLNRLAVLTDYYGTVRNWNVRFDGKNYIYYIDQLGLSSTYRLEPDVDSTLWYRVNNTARIININLVLRANLAKLYVLDLSPFQRLNARIVFDEHADTHIGYFGNGSLFLIARNNMSSLKLSGRYLVELHTLESKLTRLTFPFEMNLNLRGENLRIGPEIYGALFNSTDSLIKASSEFLSETRIYAPDISAKLQQARSYLNDIQPTSIKELENINIFPLEAAINLVCEAGSGISMLVLSSGMFIVPIALTIILIAGAVVSHLIFNGSRKLTIIFFTLLSLLAFELHPGLRLILFSTKPKALINLWSVSNVTYGIPFLMLPVASAIVSLILLLLTARLMFKYSGTTTIYSLAASTAVRMLKSRRLRGALVILTVTTIAMATVPAITLKTVVPLVTSLQETPDGEGTILFSKSWLARVVVSTPAGTFEEKYNGLFLMSLEEAAFYAEKLGMTEYTPICIAFHELEFLQKESPLSQLNLTGRGGINITIPVESDSQELGGLIIFANLTFMKNHLGLNFSGDFENGILIDKEFSRGQFFPSQLSVMGLNLNVTGVFDKSTLQMPSGEGLESYLRSRPLFIGTINWDAVQTPSRLTRDDALTEGNRMLIISSPVIGLVDIKAARNLPVFKRVVALIGTHPDANLAAIEKYLKTLVSSHKIWLSRAITTGGTGISIDVVSSYSATVNKGSQLETIQLGAPLLMALGSWESVLMMILIGSLIILNAMLNSIYERRKESIIMSSLGASPSFITYLFLTEGLIIGVMGGCLGYVLGYAWAYSIGASSPEIFTELYSLTPLLLVFVIAILVTGIGSAFPAKEAILKIVPSKIMLIRGGIDIKTEKDGSKRASTPIRLKKEQLEQFSSLIIDMAKSLSYSLYGIIVHSYEKKENGVKLNLSYRAISGLSERIADYDVEIKYFPDRNFYNVELIVKNIDRSSYAYVEHKALMKSMLYELRDELLKLTVSEQWTSSRRERQV
ncbi:MAG: FtsX-like permease family protein [Thermoproteota archaeon]